MPTYTPRNDDSFTVDVSLTTQDADVYRGFGALRFKATCTAISAEIFTDGADVRLIVDDNENMGTLFEPADNDAYTFVDMTGLDGGAEHTYQIMCASREMFIKRITVTGGDINAATLASRSFNAFYGDSITAGSVLTDFGNLWVSRYSIAVKNGWRNFGLSGSKVQSGGGLGGIDRVALINDLSPEPIDVFVLYGINDIEQGRTDTQFEADYDSMMDLLLAGTATANFWCMGILPASGGDRPTLRTAFNAKISSVVTALATSRARYINTDSWFDAATQTSDGVHPNATANVLIANKLLQASGRVLARDHYLVGPRSFML